MSFSSPPLPHSEVYLSQSTLAALDLFEGDVVSLKGKKGRQTLATVKAMTANEEREISEQAELRAATAAASLSSAAPSFNATKTATKDSPAISLPLAAMKNLALSPGDSVSLSPSPNVKFCKAVLILPFEASLKAASNRVTAASPGSTLDVFKEYLKPYFSGKFRPVSRGDVLSLPGPFGVVDFQVVELDTKEKSDVPSALVVSSTEIECDGDPLPPPPPDESPDAASGYKALGGLAKAQASLKELVELPLKHPELWTSLGVAAPRGVLLTGPSGAGKSALARAAAAEAGAYLFVINGAELLSKKAGESETNLIRAFEDAKKNGENYNGAVLFIDDIDLLAPKRDKAGTSEVQKRVVSTLAKILDGLTPEDRVVVLAATSKPGALDSALRRPGRFDRELDLGVPDVPGRLEILKIKCRTMRLAADVDLDDISKRTHGYVGADIHQLAVEAALACIREKMPAIDFDKDDVDQKILDDIVVTKEHFRQALAVVHPSSLRENQVEVPDVKWEDVGGLEDVKRELQETVQYPVEHADKFLKFGMHPSKGVLFYGPPGCGKTLLAKAIANECGANFISIKGPELLTQWFGESEANVRQLFDKARAAAPCILMFDEMDSIAKARGSGGGGGGSEAGDRVINQILTEIDGVGARKNVFVIGATNRPDILDPAVIRPGRLDQLIYIPLPDFKSRISIFKAALRKAPVAPDVNIEVLARSTSGFSGADISEICQSASKMAIREVILKDEARKREEGGDVALKTSFAKPAAFGLDEIVVDAKDTVEARYNTAELQITKRHFNHAMSKARKSVTDKDLLLFQQFAEKNKLGRGEKATNFKFAATN